MCGIAGIFNPKQKLQTDKHILEQMIKTLQHRGPDDFGFFHSPNVCLAHSRLSIIDIEGGKQPIHNENGSVQVILNGEIFNYIELREKLLKLGHRFYTRSDTEVIVHAYEQYGRDFVHQLNGQFAIAIWDSREQKLILIRDRLGIRPLFYSVLSDKTFLFASEMKAIFCHPAVEPEIDPAGLNQIFTLWVNVPPTTVFRNIFELAPGHILSVSKSRIKVHQYWKLQFPCEKDYEDKPLKYYTDSIRELMHDAVSIRLRADVPVASYLSGGLDSSIIASLIKKYHKTDLMTFSVAFKDKKYDERKYQIEMAKRLQTEHFIIETDEDSIGRAFSDVIRFAEKPLLRTAPAPLYLLSNLVKENKIKVVLTGEGADEIFGGYNIFKEDKIRRFWAKQPDSGFRPLLLEKLYPFMNANFSQSKKFWQLFFKKNLQETANIYYSHQIRWNNTALIKRFFRKQLQETFNDDEQIYQALNQYIDPDIIRWHPLSRAQYLEMILFLPGYLLSSQGDRMLMGHSIEGRFPFLDHKLVEFANTIPPQYKVKVLKEKYVLKKAFEELLPASIVQRDKQPYRAPIGRIFSVQKDNLFSELLGKEKIDAYGYFNADYVAKLRTKTEPPSGQSITARDEMALTGIVSTQLLHDHFIKNSSEPKTENQKYKIYANP